VGSPFTTNAKVKMITTAAITFVVAVCIVEFIRVFKRESTFWNTGERFGIVWMIWMALLVVASFHGCVDNK
jgi:hypothetical protein